MIGPVYAKILDKLEEFRCELRRSNIEYYLKCRRKRRSCLIIVVLKNPDTNKIVLDLRLKVRSFTELTNRLEGLLTSCRFFAMGLTPSGSPEY